MSRGIVCLLALAVLACEDASKQPAAEQPPTEVRTRPPVEPEQPVDEPPSIPGQLLDKLEVERQGSFELPEGVDEVTISASVALGKDPRR